MEIYLEGVSTRKVGEVTEQLCGTSLCQREHGLAPSHSARLGVRGRHRVPLPQGAGHQRCQFHYAKNLLRAGFLCVKRKQLGAGLRAVFSALTRKLALRAAKALVDRWRGSHPKVAEHVEEHLACRAFPESHRRRIRTANGLERFNEEIQRRSRVVRIFPNRQACFTLLTALAVETSEEWLTGRRYLNIEELTQERSRERGGRWSSRSDGQACILGETTENSKLDPPFR